VGSPHNGVTDPAYANDRKVADGMQGMNAPAATSHTRPQRKGKIGRVNVREPSDAPLFSAERKSAVSLLPKRYASQMSAGKLAASQE